MLSNIQKMYVLRFLLSLQFFGALVVPFFLDWGELNYSQLFLLGSVYMLSIMLFQMPTGVFADRYGRKASLLAGVSIWVMGTAILLSKADILIFLIAEIMWGCAGAFLSGADKALIFDALKEAKSERRAKEVFANYSVAATVGIVISLPVGTYLVGLDLLPYPNSLTITFVLSAISVLIGGVVIFSLTEPKSSKPGESMLELSKRGFAALNANRYLRSLALEMTVIAVTGGMIYWFYQSILRVFGMSISIWGLVAAGFNIFGILLLWKMTQIEKLFGTRRLLFVSAAAIGLLYVTLAISSSLLFSIPIIFLIVGLVTIRQPLFDHYMNFHIKSGERATILSAIGTLLNFGTIIAYVIVGFLADISLSLTFLAMGIITLIAALLLRSDEAAFQNG